MAIYFAIRGNSLAPLIHGTKKEIAVASFSQYPRGYVGSPDSGSALSAAEEKYSPQPSACLSHKCTMGYSIITILAGTEYRYTEWCAILTSFISHQNSSPRMSLTECWV